ncbi:MAG: hypothetical protein H7A36_04760 [Chlamydiales bacterium]|nr:hypothetical protein [Chlamydiales bacterium]
MSFVPGRHIVLRPVSGRERAVFFSASAALVTATALLIISALHSKLPYQAGAYTCAGAMGVAAIALAACACRPGGRARHMMTIPQRRRLSRFITRHNPIRFVYRGVMHVVRAAQRRSPNSSQGSTTIHRPHPHIPLPAEPSGQQQTQDRGASAAPSEIDYDLALDNEKYFDCNDLLPLSCVNDQMQGSSAAEVGRSATMGEEGYLQGQQEPLAASKTRSMTQQVETFVDTELHQALARCDHVRASQLIEEGQINLNQRSESWGGHTPLTLVLAIGYTPRFKGPSYQMLVQQMIDKGADITLVHRESKLSPLELALARREHTLFPRLTPQDVDKNKLQNFRTMTYQESRALLQQCWQEADARSLWQGMPIIGCEAAYDRAQQAVAAYFDSK